MGNQISQSARLKIKVSKMRSKANGTSEDDSTDRSSKQDEPPENISSSVFYEIEDDETNCDTKINVNSFKINYDENAEPLDSDNSSDKLSKSDSSEVLNNNKDESKSFLKKMLSRQRAVSDDCERLDDDDNPTVLNISKETSELSDENENVEIRRSLIHSTSEGSEESGESTTKLFKKKRNRLSWGGASTKKSTDETENRRSLSNNNLSEVTEEVVTDHKHRKFSRTRSIAVSRQEMGTALNTLSGNVKGGGRMAINKVSNVFHKYDNNDIKQCIDPGTKGHNGFDELRRYIKSGGELCKELAVIMHERAELEASYAKGMQKLSVKLLKASKETMGTVNQAWQMVGAEMEQEGEVHKNLSSSLADDVVKPLRNLIETQHKIRKGVEGMVDKTTRNVHEWRTAESKSKKTCYGNQKDNEKIQDMMLEARLGRGKTLTDKETIKMEKQRRKAEEAVQKGDLDYYTCCIKAERARLEWETAIYKGSNCFQTLEEERLQSLHDLILKYQTHTKDAAPKLVACVATLEEPITACDVEKDIQTVIAAKGTGENLPEQLLPDFYPEDMNNIMNRERRKESLEKFVNMLRSDLERERRGKQGVENLAKALQETPTFGGEDSQQDVNDKLQHMKAMLAYLEAARYKVQCSLDELNNRPRMTHPLAKHIEVHRDKTGASVSILKVPPWVRGNSVDTSPVSGSPAGSPNWNDRGTADGTSVQPDSDFDEFSSQGSDRDYQSAVTGDDVLDSIKSNDEAHYARPLPSIPTGGRCKALYDYEANMYDELTIRTGDIINIHEKQPDGWWVGELEGVVGIFPATYVEEID